MANELLQSGAERVGKFRLELSLHDGSGVFQRQLLRETLSVMSASSLITHLR